MRLLVCSIFNLVFLVSAYAQPGTLDNSFGEKGKSIGPDFGYCTDMTLQKDGKILMVGQSGDYLSIARFLPSGTLDTTFGKNGNQKIKIDLGTQQLNIAILPNDKFLVAGTFWEYLGNNQNGDPNYNYDFLLMRFNENGMLDSTFGENGITKSNFTSNDFEYTLALQPDNKILLGGSAIGGALIARYSADGFLDESFGNGGYKIFSSYSIIQSIAVQEDGKIITGSTNDDNYFNPKFMLIRYESNGAIDKTFGKNGTATTDFGKGGDKLIKLIIQKDGKILAAGNTNYSFTELNSEMLISRYNTNGTLDSSFGNMGKGTAAFESAIAKTNNFEVLSNGKIVLVGAYLNTTNVVADFCLAYFDEKGNNDSSFENAGLVTTDFGSYDFGEAVSIQKDGKILAAGYSDPEGTTTNFALARYLGDPTHPLITKIKTWIRRHILNFTDQNFNAAYYNIQQQNNNGVFTDVATINNINTSGNYSYNLSSKTNSETNSYRIMAMQKNGNALYSNIIKDESANQSSIKISPNPVTDMLVISGLDVRRNYEVKIMTKEGKSITTQKIQGNSLCKMNLSQLQSDIYFLKISANGITTALKFVKE